MEESARAKQRDAAVAVRARQMYARVDADRSAGVTRAELRDALRASGVWVTDARLDALFRGIDADGSGVISEGEWVDAYGRLDCPELRGLHATVCGVTEACASPDKPVVLQSGRPDAQSRFLLAGCTAGLVSKTAVAPVERVIVTNQCSTGRNAPLLAQLADTARREGAAGLWRGNAVACARQVPFAGMVCFTYTVLTSSVLRVDPDVTAGDEGGAAATARRLLAGAAAGATAAAVTYPIEVVKTRVQQKGAPGVRAVCGALRGEVRARGPPALFRGLLPTLWTVAPFVAVDKTVYATLRDKAKEQGLATTPSLILCCGAASGVAGQTVVHSLDVVRKRMQAGFGYAGVRDAVRSIVAGEGWQGLTKGLLASYCKVAPAMGVTYCTIDTTLRMLD